MTANPFPGLTADHHELCQWCLDLGVIRVTDRSDGFKTLMLCNCHEGDQQRYHLPRWNYQLGQIFSRSLCPIQWFRPDIEAIRAGNGQKLFDAIEEKRTTWATFVRMAEDYWKQAKAGQ